MTKEYVAERARIIRRFLKQNLDVSNPTDQYIRKFISITKNHFCRYGAFLTLHYPNCVCKIRQMTPFISESSNIRENIYCIENNLTQVPTCKTCGKPLRFNICTNRYPEFCSNSCIGKNVEMIRKKRESQLKHYGNQNAQCLKEVIAKAKETKRIRYNNENWNNRKKYKKTCMERYGVNNAGCSTESLKKIKETNLKRYNIENTWVFAKHETDYTISSLNRKIYRILTDHNVRYQTEYIIPYDKPTEGHMWRLYDIKFDNNVLLEINGDYVHANPRFYKRDDIITLPKEKYTAEQKWRYDENKTNLAISHGFKLVSLWEYQIKIMDDEQIFKWICTNCGII